MPAGKALKWVYLFLGVSFLIDPGALASRLPRERELVQVQSIAKQGAQTTEFAIHRLIWRR